MTLHSTLVGHGVAMLKNRFVSFSIAVAMALLTLPATAQKKAEKPNAGQLVPADSQFVISFNIGSLLKKSGHDKIIDLPGMEEFDTDLTDAVLEEAAKFCRDILLPLNRNPHVFGDPVASNSPRDTVGLL